jgi:alanine dehydrogenase
MKNVIGMRRENVDLSEKRSPLTPTHIKKLIGKKNLKVIIESSKNRIFPDIEYKSAGAVITNRLENCNVIFGVKEIPTRQLAPKQTYCFFSHTIKGQPHNMPMLKRLLDLRDTLIDYEKVTDSNGKRLFFFGRFAGYAGMINSLWALGLKLNSEKIDNPFKTIRQALKYKSLNEAKDHFKEIGKKIQSDGLPHTLVPFVCGFTGYGHVSKGAQEIFNLLPFKEITPKNLLHFIEKRNYSNKKLYKVVFKESDMFTPKSKTIPFDLTDYYENPYKYVNNFEQYISVLTVLINGIYWEPKYPRLITRVYLNESYRMNPQQKLKVIGDITCDIEGSIECNLKTTNSQNPIYVYEPLSGNIIDGAVGNGPVILAVDKLPSELPYESSESFGDALLPFVPAMAKTDYNKSYEDLKLPHEIKKAVISHNGFLTPEYKYLEKLIKNGGKK